MAEDIRGAAKLGVTLAAYEKTGQDLREDRAGQSRVKRALQRRV
jgi:hypothetical protein